MTVPDTMQSDGENALLLSISIVTFRPDLDELRQTFRSLAQALAPFDAKSIMVTVVDNSEQDEVSPLLAEITECGPIRFLHGHGNIGFGRGHNLALDRTGLFHLILNPDIVMDTSALRIGIEFLQSHPDCALLTPHAIWPGGQRQYLCKRYPAVFDLLLRGFAPAPIRTLFERRLARYEMRNDTQDTVFFDPPIASGCFMLLRSDMLKAVNGFDPRYMLYFEDFDLCLRIGRLGRIAYVPSARIIHAGGNAARKGYWHIRQFARSALQFYRINGFKFF